MVNIHMSDCALYNLPAKKPMPCDCGCERSRLRLLADFIVMRWHWMRGG